MIMTGHVCGDVSKARTFREVRAFVSQDESCQPETDRRRDDGEHSDTNQKQPAAPSLLRLLAGIERGGILCLSVSIARLSGPAWVGDLWHQVLISC